MKKDFATPELFCPPGYTVRQADIARPANGFTLIELLITLSIIAVMLSIVLPVSFSTYKNYQESLAAEKVLLFLSSMKRDSFLHSKETLIETKDGNLIVNEKEEEFEGIHIHTEKPIIFYKNGTNSGGEIQLKLENNAYLISIQTPSGDLKLMRE